MKTRHAIVTVNCALMYSQLAMSMSTGLLPTQLWMLGSMKMPSDCSKLMTSRECWNAMAAPTGSSTVPRTMR
jgi:hypothetical protein